MRGTLSLRLALGAVIVSWVASATAESERHRDDNADIAYTERRTPKAIELLKAGEAKLAAGQLEPAIKLFKEASELAPGAAMPFRRLCQALTERGGRRAEAVSACQKAVANGGTPMSQRALAGALMSGEQKPSSGNLTMAMRLSTWSKERLPHQPWGYAAECDVARRLGDGALLRKCLADLERVAPGHYETQRASLVTSSVLAKSPWWRWFGWFLVGATCLLTLAHAVWNATRRARSQGLRALLSGCLLLVGTTLAAPAGAAEPELPGGGPQPGGGFSKWPINARDPVGSVPTPEQRDSNPIEYGYHLMDLTEAGALARKKGDHLAAVNYHMALAKAVPDASRGFALVCEDYVTLGNRQKALEYCTVAITLRGARAIDYKRYAGVMLSKKGSLNADEVADLSDVIGHLRKVEGGNPVADQITCELGLRTEDAKRLEECTTALAKTAPNDERTLTYQFALSLLRKDLGQAKGFIDRARKAGMPPPAIQKMEEARSNARPMWQKAVMDWRILVPTLAVILAGAVMVVVARRRARLHPA